jgi:hypothetical protein
LVEKQIHGHGLAVNVKKRLRQGVQVRGGSSPPRVHNLDVSSRRGVGIPEEQAQKALAVAEQYVRSARVVSAGTIEAVAYKRSVLHGWVCFCRQAEIGPSSHLRRLLDAGDRIVRRRLERLGLKAYKSKWWLNSGKHNEPRRLARQWPTK